MPSENEVPQLSREQQELVFGTLMDMAERKAALVRRLEAEGVEGERLAQARWSAESAYRCAEEAARHIDILNLELRDAADRDAGNR